MTGRALIKYKRFFEIASDMARDATNRGVLSQKREFGFRVIEFKIGQDFFPTASAVTMFARFFELSVMDIGVARRAACGFHIFEARGSALRIRFVALFASHLHMQSCEREARVGVVKFVCAFPVDGVMTIRTIFSELALVIVLVTTYAFSRQAQVGLIQILVLNQTALRGRNLPRRMTLPAFDLSVLSVQGISGQLMIELLDGNLPVDETEIGPVVLQVAAHAIFALRILHLETCVVAVFFGEGFSDFLMAIETLKRGSFRAKLMAGRALGCPG